MQRTSPPQPGSQAETAKKRAKQPNNTELSLLARRNGIEILLCSACTETVRTCVNSTIIEIELRRSNIYIYGYYVYVGASNARFSSFDRIDS